MKQLHSMTGFTLIELMIVVTIVSVRAKVSEAVIPDAPNKEILSKAFETNGVQL